MSAEPLDLRMSHMENDMSELKGAYHQIDKRLTDLRSDMVGRLNDLRSDMNAGIAGLRSEMNGRFTDQNHRFSDLKAEIGEVKQRLDGIDRKIDGNFRTLITWMVGQTGVIIGALVAVAFALRHG